MNTSQTRLPAAFGLSLAAGIDGALPGLAGGFLGAGTLGSGGAFGNLGSDGFLGFIPNPGPFGFCPFGRFSSPFFIELSLESSASPEPASSRSPFYASGGGSLVSSYTSSKDDACLSATKESSRTLCASGSTNRELT